MPSAFAHAFLGASLGSLAPRKTRLIPLCLGLALAAAAPDLDVVGFALGIPYGHPLGHRGLSHSLAFAMGIGGLVFLFRRKPNRALIAALFGIAVASHGILDAFTDAGLGVGFLIPFDDTRFFAPWRPLLTSPLSISEFFEGRALRILANEAVWVGLPTLVGVLLVRFVRGQFPSSRRDLTPVATVAEAPLGPWGGQSS
ncbi:MAG: inner membrane protein [Rhodothermales bacterium]|jgi:inner membrane protein